jgi:hypothetical protein
MSRYPGRILSSTAPTVNANSAKGIWTLDEALRYQRAGTWPVPTGNGDPYFGYNTMLLPGQGTNGAQNNTFLDSSTNNFTITRNGNTTQGTFTPFSEAPGYWSNYFNGSVTTSYINSVSNTAFEFGTGDFTLEAFIYVPAYPTSGTVAGIIIAAHNWNGSGMNFIFRIGQTGLLYFENSAGNTLTASTAVALNTWAHVACVRSSGTVTFYINGTSAGSGSAAGSISSTTAVSIGNALSGGTYGNFNGYISNARITKGGALYTGTFTPSTTPLTTTVSAGTVSLLTCQSNTFIDNSVNAFALTTGATTSVQTFQPFGAPTSAYSAATIGGSGYFDGTGDFLTVSDSASLEPGSSDFTIECWIYPTATGSFLGVFSKRTNNATDYSPIQILINSGTMVMLASTSGSSWAVNVNASSSPPLNAWSHIAVVRNGTGSNNLVLYLNGVSVATGSVSSTALVNNAGAWAIAADSDDGGGNFAGYICGFRSVIGNAVYTSAFTPPTAPPTAITNTQLLLNYTNAGVIDNAVSNDLETVGNAQISTAQYKWGASSIAFDGSGDYLVQKDTPNLTLGTGDFTIEFWVYYNSGLTADVALFDCRPASTNGVYPLIFSNTTGKIVWYINSAARITGTTTLVTGTWYHVAVSRSASSTKLFINGNQDGSTYADTNNYLLGTNRPLIGAAGATVGADPLNGYLTDLRVTKGLGRYLYNFNRPSAAFPLFYQAAATPSSDPYFQNTTLLLPGNGTNGAQNNTFLDSSTNAFTITRSGNVTQGTFAPFSKIDGRWGNYFDGTGDYLTTPSNAALSFGTGDFTVEFWYYHLSRASTDTIAAPSTDNLNIYINTSGVLGYYNGSSGQNSSCTVPLNEWGHVALVRSGSTLKMYYNGVEVLSQSNTTNLGTASWYIGTNPGNTDPSNGYISNLRLVKGTAVYTAAFTPSTTPLTAISGTSLLTCQSNRFIDNSTNAFAITRNGDVSVQTFSPFPTLTAYASGTNGGSGYFDGTGDYLTAPNNTAFDFGSGDWTIETWVYASSLASQLTVFAKRADPAAEYRWIIGAINTNGTINTLITNNGSSWIINGNTTSTITVGSWNHIAWVRSGNDISVFVNGVKNTISTGVLGSIYNGTEPVVVGASGTTGSIVPMNGYLSSFRIVKGTAVYTATFTPPTAPLTAITNTSLLCNFTNGGIIDNTMSNDLETVGGAAISTTQSKFGGSSMYFDGTGDYLVAPATTLPITFGTGDFTVECWIYPSSVSSGTTCVVSNRFDAGADTVMIFGFGTTNGLFFHTQSTAILNSSVNLTASTWQHIALSRYGGTVKIFLNGSQVGSASSAQNLSSTASVYFGQDGTKSSGAAGQFNGYIDDLRITKGIARYVQNFTPPTQAFLTL